jgi:hypothetical protein
MVCESPRKLFDERKKGKGKLEIARCAWPALTGASARALERTMRRVDTRRLCGRVLRPGAKRNLLLWIGSNCSVFVAPVYWPGSGIESIALIS